MRDFTDDLKDLRRRLGEAEGYLKIDTGRSRLAELETTGSACPCASSMRFNEPVA